MRFMVFYVTQFLTVSLISTDVKQSINVNTGIQEWCRIITIVNFAFLMMY